MEKLFERLDLYDILTMVFPGGILLLCVLFTGDMYSSLKQTEWMHHILSQQVFSTDVLLGCMGVMLAYLLGLINHTLVTIVRALIENYLCFNRRKCLLWLCIAQEYKSDTKVKELLDHNNDFNCQEMCSYKNDKLQHAYEKAHNAVRKKANSSSIVTIENQVAMLRDSILPLCWLICLSMYDLGIACWLIFCVVLGVFLVFVAIISAREYKIFAMVLSKYTLLDEQPARNNNQK